MKRLISVMLIAGILAGCLFGCKKEQAAPAPAPENMVTVWLLSEYRSETGGSISVDAYVYDEQGNRTQITRQENEAETRSELSYDEQGRVTEVLTYQNGEPITRQTCVYDDRGNLTEKRIVDVQYDVLIEAALYTYDEKGNQIKKEYYLEGDISTTAYAYNEQGMQTNSVLIKSDGTVTETTTGYDSRGNVIEKAEYIRDVLQYCRTYVYDENGRLVKETEDTRTKKTTKTYEYDNGGNKTACYNGNIKTVYSYDSENRLVKEEWYDGDKLYYQDLYQYDEKGNLIARTSGGQDYSKAEEAYLYDEGGRMISYTRAVDGKQDANNTCKYIQISVTESQANQLKEKYPAGEIYIGG